MFIGFIIYFIEILAIHRNKKIWQKFQESSYELAYGQLLLYGSSIGIIFFLIYSLFANPWLLGTGSSTPIIHIELFDSIIFPLSLGFYIAFHSIALSSMGVFRTRESIFSNENNNFSLTIKNETIIIPFNLKSNRFLDSNSDKMITLAIFQKMSGSKVKHISYNSFITKNDLNELFVIAAFDPINHVSYPFAPIYRGNKTKIIYILDQIKKLGPIEFHNPKI